MVALFEDLDFTANLVHDTHAFVSTYVTRFHVDLGVSSVTV